jgi:hypothetical protein
MKNYKMNCNYQGIIKLLVITKPKEKGIYNEHIKCSLLKKKIMKYLKRKL